MAKTLMMCWKKSSWEAGTVIVRSSSVSSGDHKCTCCLAFTVIDVINYTLCVISSRLGPNNRPFKPGYFRHPGLKKNNNPYINFIYKNIRKSIIIFT